MCVCFRIRMYTTFNSLMLYKIYHVIYIINTTITIYSQAPTIPWWQRRAKFLQAKNGAFLQPYLGFRFCETMERHLDQGCSRRHKTQNCKLILIYSVVLSRPLALSLSHALTSSLSRLPRLYWFLMLCLGTFFFLICCMLFYFVYNCVVQNRKQATRMECA